MESQGYLSFSRRYPYVEFHGDPSEGDSHVPHPGAGSL